MKIGENFKIKSKAEALYLALLLLPFIYLGITFMYDTLIWPKSNSQQTVNQMTNLIMLFPRISAIVAVIAYYLFLKTVVFRKLRRVLH